MALLLKTFQISGSTDFIQNSLINFPSEQVLSRLMHFQNCDCCNKSETYYMNEHRWKIPKHIFADVYLYVTLFRIKLGDSAPEKEFDITMQMTPEKVLVQRSKQYRNGRKK